MGGVMQSLTTTKLSMLYVFQMYDWGARVGATTCSQTPYTTVHGQFSASNIPLQLHSTPAY